MPAKTLIVRGNAFSPLRTGLFAVAMAATLTLGPGGCATEGGSWMSVDEYTYISTPHRPWTVTLKDTRTGQAIWSVDVPVGKQLSMKFAAGEGTKDKYTPDRMRWAIVDAGDTTPRLGNDLPVPPAECRRLDPTLRATPELPEGMTPGRRPAPATPAPTSNSAG